MTPENFKLIVITHEKYVTGEAGLINALFESGLQLLHIRKPSYHLEGIRNLLNTISKDFHPKIVLHSYYEFLEDFDLKGAHLPEKIRKESNISGIKNIVSTSFHTVEEITDNKANFEYAIFSPIFKSISKLGYSPSSETKKMKSLLKSGKDQIPFPVIGLGGITDRNVLQLQDMGFSGAACLGYIWEGSNPVERFKKIQKIAQY
jgi:thiamine-phosphate pyrophosphorylase